MSLRLGFLGTAEFAVPALRALREAGHEIALVVCQPDRPQGRGHRSQPPPLKRAAQALGLEVRQPESLRDPAAWGAFRDRALDLACVVAYGQILPRELLDAPRLGCVNLHASLLPRWRGAAPIEWALAAGDAETGVCVQKMARRLDAGDVLLRERRVLGPDDDAPGLHRELAETGAKLLVRAVEGLAAGALEGEPQDEARATYARLLTKADGRLDYGRPRAESLNRFRAFKERPGVRTALGPGEAVRVLALADAGPSAGRPGELLAVEARGLRVACADGALWLERVVPPSGRPMGAAECARGRGLRVGEILPAVSGA